MEEEKGCHFEMSNKNLENFCALIIFPDTMMPSINFYSNIFKCFGFVLFVVPFPHKDLDLEGMFE